MNINFDKSLKRQFLESQKLAVDANGYIFDTVAGSRVTDDNGQFIKAKDFGGMRKGSRIFLSKDIDTLIKEATLDQNKKNEQV